LSRHALELCSRTGRPPYGVVYWNVVRNAWVKRVKPFTIAVTATDEERVRGTS